MFYNVTLLFLTLTQFSDAKNIFYLHHI